MNNTFREACIDACLRQLEELPSEEELTGIHTFSRGFEKKMELLISAVENEELRERQDIRPSRRRRLSSPARRRLKLIAILAAALLLLCACATAVLHFTVEKYDDRLDVIFSKKSDDGIVFRTPAIPEEYEMAQEYSSEYIYWGDYRYKDELITYYQYSIKYERYSFDTEFSDPQNIKIGTYNGIRFQMGPEECIFWTDEKYGYLLTGTCDYEFLLKIAEDTAKQDTNR